MLRRLQAFLVIGVWVIARPALADKPNDQPEPEATSDDEHADEADSDETPAKPARKLDAEKTQAVQPSTPPALAEQAASTEQAAPAEQADDWHTEIHGYFRAPLAIGISPRRGPDDPSGPARTQLSYGPNRTIDANYYSFAYTRLQEQDWAEVFIHAKKKHVDVAVGWMGYWFQSAGYRNPDAGWAPGLAYLTLDSDFALGTIKPNIAITGGAFWPKFGYFEKYDTYTLGRFRQIGEQASLTLPLSPDVSVNIVQGFGGGRDGSFNYGAPPPYQATTGLDLLHYENIRVSYKSVFDVGLHYNNEWTADPNLTLQTTPGKAYAEAHDAHLSVAGAEANLRAPYFGHVWVSPSYIKVRNGWALANGGTEVMHSIGGLGIAGNYLGWNNAPNSSTGSGSLTNVGFLYENSLSSLEGKALGGRIPDVLVSGFGLLARAKLDLPAGSTFPILGLDQFKYGADITFQAQQWLGLMLRWDAVNYDLSHSGYVFSAITSRVTFSSHFLSGESFYIQYSRYRYGDHMTLAGQWPWGQQLIPGSDIVQGQTAAYSNKPDMDVVKLQATAAF
ncbi:MAG TPA: hypothetical protein VGI10_18150 [Polyangiaceae bacterium]|jgi:hypothetical protein